jgi:hypothetical protein
MGTLGPESRQRGLIQKTDHLAALMPGRTHASGGAAK